MTVITCTPAQITLFFVHSDYFATLSVWYCEYMSPERFSYTQVFLQVLITMIIIVVSTSVYVHATFAEKDETLQSAQLVDHNKNVPPNTELDHSIRDSKPTNTNQNSSTEIVPNERDESLSSSTEISTHEIISNNNVHKKSSANSSHSSVPTIEQPSEIVAPPLTHTAEPMSMPSRFDIATMLSAQNTVRASVGIAPLTWSDSLTQSAQSWADTLKTKGCVMEHDPTTEYGENIGVFWNSEGGGTTLIHSPEYVIQRFASESEYYNYTHNTCKSDVECGHYTQIIWKDTTEVGCAVQTCTAGGKQTDVWVCRYSPAGNNGLRPY
jgi:pathogenesis-related protein 1